jgi:hypothetical protein
LILTKTATKPTISEFEYEEMQYMLSEALESKRKIKISMADGKKYFSMVGVPIADGNKLSLITEDGTKVVQTNRIYKIELL